MYCTSWTFFGSVGVASSNGLDFLPIYIGPMLVFGFGWPLVARVARLANAQNTTSIADFLAARYGKSQAVAAVTAAISVLGVTPYIALQIRAIAATLAIGLGLSEPFAQPPPEVADPLSAASVVLLALFAMAFGTRRIAAGERQSGLMLTIAAESTVKLLAFLAVGAFVVWGMYDGIGDLFRRAATDPKIHGIISSPPDPWVWATLTLLSSGAMLFLPRQFHVAIVENHDEDDIRTAAFGFPLYLVAINLFVVPLAIAGLLTFPNALNRDLSVIALPMSAGNGFVTLLAMIGGLSAATAMVVVEIGSAVRHGDQRPDPAGDAAPGAPARVAERRRHRRSPAAGAATGDRRHPGAVLFLFPRRRRGAAGLARRAVVRLRGAAWPGFRRRAVLAARHRARRHRRADHRRGDLGLCAAGPLARRGLRPLGGALPPAIVDARPWRAVEPRWQRARLCRVFPVRRPHPIERLQADILSAPPRRPWLRRSGCGARLFPRRTWRWPWPATSARNAPARLFPAITPRAGTESSVGRSMMSTASA